MRFRPCIDLRNGKVTQIVGSTITDENDSNQTQASSEKKDQSSTDLNGASVEVNYVSERSSSHFATMYKDMELPGGHVIMLGPGNEEAACEALQSYPRGLQVGGGINLSNAKKYLDAGASQVIVTSFIFRDGAINFERLTELYKLVGKDRLVLDLSCRRRPGSGADTPFYVVTDRWTKFTDFAINKENLERLASYCCEFLVHGVDVEGKRQGVLSDLVSLLAECSPIPTTYAGGVRSLEDVRLVNRLGKGKIDLAIGSALDIFGGDLRLQTVVEEFERLAETDHDEPSNSS